jgi:hypothetical protein
VFTLQVSNTGSQATSPAMASQVWFTVPAGLVVVHGGQ